MLTLYSLVFTRKLISSLYIYYEGLSLSFAKKKAKNEKLILFTGAGQNPLNHRFIKLYMNSVKISTFHQDWVTKGAHVHLGGIEFTIKPAHNGMIAITPTFSFPKKRNFRTFAKMIAELLEHKPFRNKLIAATQTAKNTFGSSKSQVEVDVSFQFYFLEKALNKY